MHVERRSGQGTVRADFIGRPVAVSGSSLTAGNPEALASAFRAVRSTTRSLCSPLEIEDYVVQSMPDCSPAKWHLAHTTWFFEQFILSALPEYETHHPAYAHLFNSYSLRLGTPHTRSERGLLTRPTVDEVEVYRRHVDEAMLRFIASGACRDAERALVVLGLHHEQQHQELLLTDIKHLFAQNPLEPAYGAPRPRTPAAGAAVGFRRFVGGRFTLGNDGREAFSFDNEGPAHDVLVAPFELASRPVTNGEFKSFIADGGYRRSALWLADGWACVEAGGWARPLYWDEPCASVFTLGGRVALDPREPVAHLSFYEADAYARWAGCRLPREDEWEWAAGDHAVEGNFLESGVLNPVPVDPQGQGIAQLFGDVWEWTSSPYAPYPGFRPARGDITEYNGKFMVNQIVLRGGSCVSPRNHIRATYRNFMPPSARWQFSGLRLARDAT